MKNIKQEFIQFAIEAQVIRFGEFITKAGRSTPYFFNAGLFNDGKNLGRVAEFYADTLLNSKLEFDMLFGPAYKGITLASATAVALASKGKNVPFAFNRKEAKDHGEGGKTVGAALQGRIVIVDDVISAGTSVRESVNLIKAAGATPAAVLIALDRMERSGNEGALSKYSAAQEISIEFSLPVIAIANLDDLFLCLNSQAENANLKQYQDAVANYREKYGI